MVLMIYAMSKAVGMKIHHGLMAFASKRGPSIMKSEDREVTFFRERDRQVINEGDMDTNFDLVKEAVYASMESWLVGNSKHEIAVLADFEAGCCTVDWFMGPTKSLKSNCNPQDIQTCNCCAQKLQVAIVVNKAFNKSVIFIQLSWPGGDASSFASMQLSC